MMSLSSTEFYHYGKLLALAQEQEEAIEKLARGELGWWGRNRMAPRAEAMNASLNKITQKKIAYELERRDPELDAAVGFKLLIYKSVLQRMRSDLDDFSREGLVGKFWPRVAFEHVHKMLDHGESQVL